MPAGHIGIGVLAAACVLSGAGWSAAADFHVAPDGRDDAAGTKAAPFATLSRARDAVRALIAAGLKRDVTVEIAGGRYELDGPVVFGPADSGTAEHAVTYAAAAGETPVFSGGRTIRGLTRTAEGRWTGRIDDVAAGRWRFNELFVNGRRAVRARYPNEGFHRLVKPGSDQRTSFTFRAGDVGPWKHLTDVEVVFLHDWSTSRVRVAEVDAKARVVTLRDPIGSAAAHYRMTHFEPHPRYFLENVAGGVDAPGEWRLDVRTGELSYLPRAGEELSSAEIVAPASERLLAVRGRAGRPVRNLRFVGLTFEHCAFPRPAHGYAAGQAGFYDDRTKGKGRFMRLRMPAAVELEAAVGCVLQRCRVAHVGAAAVSLRRGCRDCRVIGCEIADAGGNGVMVGETGQAPADMAAGNAVTHCRIHDCGATFYGCVGVWVGITEGTVVARNEICRLPYTGVSVGWQWNPRPTPCRDNRVEANHIHHVMGVLSDGGGIYTLGRQPGTVLKGNSIHDVPRNAGRAESNGMFIDEGSSEVLIEGNTIYAVARSPIRFHKALRDTIRGNTLVVPPGGRAFTFNACRAETMTFAGNRIIKGREAFEPLSDVGPGPEYRPGKAGGAGTARQPHR